VYGVRKKGEFEWDAAQCLKGQTTLKVNNLHNILKESQPDPDLGHTNKFGFRNTTKEGDQNRVFGTPTIRDDITRKTQKSIADPNVPYIINNIT
jgi:hypothetical protein